MQHVIANSVRFAPEYGDIIWHTRVTEGKVEFEFIDSGSGFSEEDLRFMFQRFYQGIPLALQEETCRARFVDRTHLPN